MKNSCELFHEIEDARAILASKGVYKQVKVFRRGVELYASYWGGYIRLYSKGTSLPHVRLEGLDISHDIRTVEFDKLILDE